MEQDNSNKPVNWIPWLILLVCLLPSICANFLYKANLVNSKETKQRGSLVTPAQPAEHLKLENITSDLKSNQSSNKVWNLVYVAPKPCSHDCKQRIHELQNLKIALGRDYHKVNINTALPQVFDGLSLNENEVYIMDPNGFIMMQYQTQQTTSDILKDVKHLLRYSNG